MTKADIEGQEKSNQITIESRATTIIGFAGALLALFADLITNQNIGNTILMAFLAVLSLLISILLGISAIYFANIREYKEKLLEYSLFFLVTGLIITAATIVSTMFENVFYASIAGIVLGGMTMILFQYIIKKVKDPHKHKNDSNKASFLELLERP